MFTISRTVRRPVAMFVDQSDAAMIEAAVDAGVSAYIVDGLRKERVKAILDMAVSRFNAFERLRRELAQAKDQLAERKTIERAKGILMRGKVDFGDEAYALLRRTAMNENRRIAEVAQSVVWRRGCCDDDEPAHRLPAVGRRRTADRRARRRLCRAGGLRSNWFAR